MNWLIEQRVDLVSGPYQAPPLYTLMFPGDKLAHVWALDVYADGEAVDLSGGSAAAYFRRLDGQTVMITGTVAANRLSFTLTQEVYAIPGAVEAGVRYTKSGATVTVAHQFFDVQSRYETSSTIDPGEAIPSIDDLLNMVENMEYCVRYDAAQGLTTAQKAQARSNIGLTFTDAGSGVITIS